MWMLLAVLATANAGDCNVAAVTEATPASVATAWARLAACDGDLARQHAEQTFSTALPGADSHEALLAGVKLGIGAPVRSYIERVPPDDRSKAISYLGKQCEAVSQVAPFFVASQKALGADFWAHRWHRGLSTCRTPEVQGLLDRAIFGDGAQTDPNDRAQVFSVLEVYARNLRGAALPKLAELANSLEDQEEQIYVVNAFADAAGVGSPEGLDHKVAEAATETLVELGPKLPWRAVEQARTTLLALDEEQASNEFVRFRWPARFRLNDYRYVYAVAVTETSTCTNGKQQALLHTAIFTEPAGHWPDQLEEELSIVLASPWNLGGGNVCKGEYTRIITVPSEPFETRDAAGAWLVDQVQAFQQATAGYKKTSLTKEPGFDL